MAGHINFYSEDIPFKMREIKTKRTWIIECITTEGKENGDISFVFCSDEFLHKMNVEYLSHDTLTDVITFDYTEDGIISGDIFISIPRVKENASVYSKDFIEELNRVMIHGVLHLCGYKDKSSKDSKLMRQKEDEKLLLLDPKL
jgi:rRNA maturation RNase YbeY